MSKPRYFRKKWKRKPYQIIEIIPITVSLNINASFIAAIRNGIGDYTLITESYLEEFKKEHIEVKNV